MRRVLLGVALLLLLAAPAGALYPKGYRGVLVVHNLSGDFSPNVAIAVWPSGQIVLGPTPYYGLTVKIRGVAQRQFYQVGLDDDGDGTVDSWSLPVFVRKRAHVFVF